MTPRQRLRGAQDAFEVSIEALIVLRDAEKFNADEVEQIILFSDTCDELLDMWEDAVLNGKDPPDLMDAFNVTLGKLIEYKLRGQNDG